jgi:hypothetical protein
MHLSSFEDNITLANGDDDGLRLFEGSPKRLLPTYSSRIVFSGIIEAIGKMIAHSVSQCGLGLSRLSPVCYWYIVYGDIGKAISFAELSHVHDPEIAAYPHKVNIEKNVVFQLVSICSSFNFVFFALKVVKASSKLDLDELNGGSTFINILLDIGNTSILSVSTF